MAKNAFVQSMKTIAESTIHNAGFDKTRSGKVVGKNTLTNTYSVKIDGHVYNNVHVTNDATYNIGDTVKVNMPCNQPSQMIIVSSIFSDVSLGKKIGHAQSLIDAMDEQLEDIKEIDGHIYQLNINSNYTAANSTHTGQILKDGVDVTSATYYNNFRWYLMKSTGKVQITSGISNATLTMQIADYMYGMALILEWIDGNGGALLRKQIVLFDNNVVKEKITQVENTATEAKTIADNTEQYFWHTTSGTDTGTHITQVQKDTFTALPDGYNLLAKSNGVAVRNALDEMAIFKDDGVYFNGYVSGQWQQIAAYTTTYAQIGGTGSDKNNVLIDRYAIKIRKGVNSLATFSSNGLEIYSGNDYENSVASFGVTARVGKIANGVSRMITASTGIDFIRRASGADNILAHIGYDSTVGQSGMINAPYYTFGTRKVNSTIGAYSFATGMNVTSSGYYSHAEGHSTTASGYESHAEGYNTIASGGYSHAEGVDTTSSGTFASHTEGRGTVASGGDGAHAEGFNTTASGTHAHSEGRETVASGFASHAEGCKCESSGGYSHAEGYQTIASGYESHAQNIGTIANGTYQTVLGKYNVSDTVNALILGNGSSNSARSNALTVDWNGKVNAFGYTSPYSVSGASHADALRTFFNSYKTKIQRNCILPLYSSAYSNGSLCMGYYLAGYDSNPYGGFFICHYNTPRYVGISNGAYTEHVILTNQNWSGTITKSALGLGNVDNKSSATIRSEITKSNVTSALGGTPMNYTSIEVHTASFTIPATGTNAHKYESYIGVSSSGKSPKGVVGWSFGGGSSTFMNLFKAYVNQSEGRLYYGVRDLSASSSNLTGMSISFYVYYDVYL